MDSQDQDRKVTWEEFAQHSTQKSLWVMVDGRIYDVTSFLAQHPGGDDILLKHGGLDATESFKRAKHSYYAISLRGSRMVGQVGYIESTQRPEWYGEHEKKVRELNRKISAPTNPEQQINWSEVVKHNNRKDIWIVIEGKVYDVTDFQYDHPGGTAAMIAQVGRDATEPFNDVGHSQDAKNLRKKLQIGVVVGKPPSHTVVEKSSKSKVLFLVAAILIGIAYKFYFSSMFQ